MDNRCSGMEPNGGCSHGHAFTMACFGNNDAPSCTREDLKFDEERQVVTIDTWPVSRRDRRLAATEVPNAEVSGSPHQETEKE